MIEVVNLNKSYGGITAIQNLNFSVKTGEVVGFLGPNGAGKSTTMKIITGFMAPSSGKATVAGFDVFESPLEVKRRIGYLPETPPVYGDMLVKDYLEYVAQLKKVEKASIKKFIDSAIEKTNLGEVQGRLIQNLSKGFRQRVGIAQALVSNPEVLILDEPTVGLDPKQVSEIRQLINELRGHHTIILSTHILPEVQATCERIVIIHRGQIVAQDSMDNLTKIQSGFAKVKLQVRRHQEQLKSSLAGVSGVRKVNQIDQLSYEIEVGDQEDIVERVASFVINSGAGLKEVSSVKADLEDVFLNLTYGQNQQQEVMR